MHITKCVDNLNRLKLDDAIFDDWRLEPNTKIQWICVSLSRLRVALLEVMFMCWVQCLSASNQRSSAVIQMCM